MKKLLTFMFTCIVWPQISFADEVIIKSQQLAPELYMLQGQGGNIAALLGTEGALVIDAQFATAVPAIKAELNRLHSGNKIKLLVNTHYHQDHVNGNAAMADGAPIIAHSLVLQRLQQKTDFPKAGLPTETFTGLKELQLNGQQIQLRTMPASHTDGDLVVWFKEANVLHMGDLFFADRFPFIDLNSGGSISGYIQNIKSIYQQIDDKTKLIPGHGNLMDKAGLLRFIQMIDATKQEVQQMQQQGFTVEQAVKQGLSAQWKNWSWDFITEERWIRTLYQG